MVSEKQRFGSFADLLNLFFLSLSFLSLIFTRFIHAFSAYSLTRQNFSLPLSFSIKKKETLLSNPGGRRRRQVEDVSFSRRFRHALVELHLPERGRRPRRYPQRPSTA